MNSTGFIKSMRDKVIAIGKSLAFTTLFLSFLSATAAAVSNDYQFYSGPSSNQNLSGTQGLTPTDYGYTYRGTASTTHEFTALGDKKVVVLVPAGNIAYIDAVAEYSFGTYRLSTANSLNTLNPENVGSNSDPDGLYCTVGDGVSAGYIFLDGSSHGLLQGYITVNIVDVDATPPVTTTDPAGGLYPPGLTVTLSCDDGSGSGCDTIYYTTNGDTPTTDSSVYSTSFTFTSTTFLQFFSVDAAGNQEEVRYARYIMDNSAPADPTGLTGSSNDDGTILLSWTPPPEGDLQGYYLYRDSFLLHSSIVPTPSYTDLTAEAGSSYTYTVTSVDYTGNESSGADLIVTSIVDAGAPPGAPEGVQVENSGTGTSLDVSWLPNGEADLLGYTVWWGTSSGSYSSSANAGNTTYEITDLTEGERYFIVVTALDGDGNESDASLEVTATPSTIASRPDPVTGLIVTEGNGTLALSWDDAAGVSGYKVYIGEVDGLYGRPVRTDETDYSFDNLENGKTYYVAVTTYDLSPGSRYDLSSESTKVTDSGTPYDGDAPAAPANVTATDAGTGGTVVVQWDRGEDFDIAGYLVSYLADGSITFDGTISVGVQSHALVTGLTDDSNYTFYVSAIDSSGNVSDTGSDMATPTSDGSPGDLLPPGKPFIDAVPGNGNVTINITSPGDDDVVLYRIYNLAAGKFMPLDSTDGLAYEHRSGVENGIPLVYVVSAEDGNGNEGAFSDPAFVIPGELPGNIPLEIDPPVLDRVDSYDIIEIANGFGRAIGHPDYNPGADLNGDGIIDEKDMSILLPNHGKKVNP